jgi:hypothetical protein
MDIKEIKKRYTKVARVYGEWNCFLIIDNQSFRIESGSTKKSSAWYAEMLAIALKKLFETAKNTEYNNKKEGK